jgi:hypothetical protein
MGARNRSTELGATIEKRYENAVVPTAPKKVKILANSAISHKKRAAEAARFS